MDRVLLAVYGLEVFRRGDSQLPSRFAGSVDLLKLFSDFAQHVLENVQHQPGKRVNHRLTLCDHTLHSLDETTREVYGFFNAGRDGDNFTAAKFDEQGRPVGRQAKITRDMHTMRDSFFYLKVPSGVGKKRAYLILQRADGQGVKGLVLDMLQKYMHARGLQEYRLVPFNLVPERVFTDMMDNGSFKQVTLIKHGLPQFMEGTRNQEEMIPLDQGKLKITYQSNNLGTRFKEWGKTLFSNSVHGSSSARSSRVVVQINGNREEYDEVNMLLELNGKQKTFHLASASRTQPDMDVTNNVEHDEHGRLRLDQLLEQARDLVDSVSLDIRPDDISPDQPV